MDLGTILIFMFMLFLSGMFSGTETAVTAVSTVTLTRLAAQGNRSARLLLKILADKGRIIAALLVCNNCVNTALAVYATVVFDSMLKGVLPPWAAPIVASVAAVTVTLIFGEVLPKTIAVGFKNKWALSTAWFAFALLLITWPVTWLLIQGSNAIMRLMGRRPGEQDIFDVHEIHTMAHMGEQAGVIDSVEMKLIQKAAHLNDTRVSEIMIPRTDIQGIEVNATLPEIRAFFQKTAYSRIPVYKGDLDDIIGVLNFKEFLRLDPARERGFDLTAFLHKALFVPGSMFIGDLLGEMRGKHSHLAVVLDEYGGTAGLITLEDVIEMLVGRIDDEYDVIATPVNKLDDRTFEFDGRLTDERLMIALGIELPQEALEGFDTVAGLALKAFGNIPSESDTTTYHGLEITATEVKGHRVRRVKVRILSPQEIAGQPTAGSSRRRTTRVIAAEAINTAGGGSASAERQEQP